MCKLQWQVTTCTCTASSFFFAVCFLVICKTERPFQKTQCTGMLGSLELQISQSVTMPFTCAECFALLFHPSFCSFRKHKQHKLDYFDIAKFICTACLSHMVAPQDNAWLQGSASFWWGSEGASSYWGLGKTCISGNSQSSYIFPTKKWES